MSAWSLGKRMSPDEQIDAYLRAELEKERNALDPRIRLVAEKAREFYWTASRLLGLGHLHDGRWRKPKGAKADNLRSALTGDIPEPPSQDRLLIDMTATHRYRKHTGVQRVVREIARVCVETGAALPVFIEGGRLYSHFKHKNLPGEIEFQAGDRFLLLDSGWGFHQEYPPLIEAARRANAEVIGCLYDLIPLRYPTATEPANCRAFVEWFDSVILKCDAIACISKSVADDLVAYLQDEGRATPRFVRIGWWPLGADFNEPAKVSPSSRARAIAEDSASFFLSVGTLEPRKAYPIALGAFEKLWAQGLDYRYVIVGRRGWNTSAFERRIRHHVEYQRRLFWLDDASDTDLHYLYRHARALVFASFAEGFGMPLVEAARHGVRVIASDIPVFREIGAEGATYFPLLDSDTLAARISETPIDKIGARLSNFIAWRESAATLVALVQDAKYQLQSDSRREWAREH